MVLAGEYGVTHATIQVEPHDHDEELDTHCDSEFPAKTT